jgi:predicted tellurium resistance membrane protein TerC
VAELFTVENLFTLAMLIFLQAVLGFDNLLYISLESKRVVEEDQQKVRRIGIGLAILLRIVLLYVVVQAISMFQAPWFDIHFDPVISGEFNVHSIIVLVGGAFIVHTAFKEIGHMLVIDHLGHDVGGGPRRSTAAAIGMIVLMNLVFSFDSILSALALTRVFAVMAFAIVVSGVLMMVMADTVAEFLKRNRMYEVLGLFILLIVGVMLLSEGGHLAHLHLGGYPVEAMSKTTFYFSIGVLVVVDVAQSRYQKKLALERQAAQSRGVADSVEHA